MNFVCSERALLNRLFIELYKLDSDVLVGHNISGFDLDVLLHRAQVGTLLAVFMYLLYLSMISKQEKQEEIGESILYFVFD